MAISATHYRILRELKQRGVLPQGGSILEIGQANWYGDMDPDDIRRDFLEWAAAQNKDIDTRGLARLLGLDGEQADLFRVARNLIYRIVFDHSHVTAIDADPLAPGALKLDLNGPLDLSQPFDTSINHGTAEHIFNIAQVFATMHQWTRPRGLMIHEAPFTGWVDHGFYCLQPTLFWDLAAVNGYEMVGVWVEHLASRSYFSVDGREALLERRRCDQLPDNSMLFVVMRKGADDTPFRVPIQGVYAGRVSESVQQAWGELR